MSMHSLQVTIVGTNTPQQISTTSINVRRVVFQNNAGHSMRLADSNVSSTRGLVLQVGGGSIDEGTFSSYNTDLMEWWVNGTASDVLDLLYFT